MDEPEIQESINKIKSDLQAVIQKENIKDLIKDNVITFNHKNVQYRVKKPNAGQRYLVNEAKATKFISLLRDPSHVLESDLISLYQQKGINIKELDDKYTTLSNQKKDYDIKLGKLLEENKDSTDIEVYKKEIEQINAELDNIMMRKIILLEPSIESQINVFFYSYLAYVVTEKLDNEKWIKAWSNYEEFLKEEEELTNYATFCATIIFRNET